MRFPIPLVIDMDDDQLAAFFDAKDLPHVDGIRAKDAVEAVRAHVTAAVLRDFTTLGVRAGITIKR